MSGDAVDKAGVLEVFQQRLREAGLKSTRQRDQIAETFFALDRHISVEELLAEVRKEMPQVGYATVYRTLKLLVEQKLANPRDFGDGQTRYDPQFDKEQHDHLICVECRRILEFDDEVILARLTQIARERGFGISRRKLEIYGVCGDGQCPWRPRGAQG
jgi:Fur family ferric uptake transcriptional regulator